MEVEALVGLCVLGEGQIQPGKEVDPPVDIAGLPVALEPPGGILEIVLDNNAGIRLRQPVPHLPVPVQFLLQQGVHRLGRVRQKGPAADVPVGGVDIDDVRLKFLQGRIGEHGVLPVLSVLALVEGAADAVVEQEQLQHVPDVMGSGAAEDGDPLADEVPAALQ